MGRSRYRIYENNIPCFITCTTVRWLPLFSIPWAAEIVLSSLKFLQSQNRITLYAFVLLENHLHLVVSSTDLSGEIGAFKSYTARTIIDRLIQSGANRLLGDYRFYKVRHKDDRSYQIWQEGMHPKQIHSREMMEQKIRYIHDNPVRRGYVDDPVHWRYSSARNYAGMEGVLAVDVEWWNVERGDRVVSR